MHGFLEWWAYHLGIDPKSQWWYNFWSGFGSDIGEVTIIGGIVAIYQHHVCHDEGCWRPGKHLVTIGNVTVRKCRKHSKSHM